MEIRLFPAILVTGTVSEKGSTLRYMDEQVHELFE